jgi:RNA polymerase sigma-70 factor (sigma-E family)
VFGSGKASRDAEFTAFVDQASPGLVRMAYALTGSADAAHELVQAALVKTYVAWPRIRKGEALAYTRRVVANQRIDTWRSTRREVSTDTPPDAHVATDPRVEHRDEIVRMLTRLPEQQRKVVVLRYYNDLSEQAVADLLGISVGAVKSAASRGLAALRTQNARTQTHEAGSR